MKEKKTINFSQMTQTERQVFADFLLHEIHRHQQDINRAKNELKIMSRVFGVYPRKVYVGVWIEVDSGPVQEI